VSEQQFKPRLAAEDEYAGAHLWSAGHWPVSRDRNGEAKYAPVLRL